MRSDTKRLIRSQLRRTGIAHWLFVILFSIFFWINPERMLGMNLWLLGFVAFTCIVVLFITIDIVLLYRLVRKLQPIAPMHAAREAYIFGTSQSELRALLKKDSSLREDLLKKLAEAPGTLDKELFRTHLDSHRYTEAVILLEKAYEKNERAQRVQKKIEAQQYRRQQRIEQEKQDLLLLGIDLGIDEQEMRQALAEGRGSTLIGQKRDLDQISAKAQVYDCHGLIVPLLAERQIIEAKALVDRATGLLEDANRLGIENEVRERLRGDQLDAAAAFIRFHKLKQEKESYVSTRRQKIDLLAITLNEDQGELTDLLQLVEAAEWGSRTSRKARHDLERLLANAR